MNLTRRRRSRRAAGGRHRRHGRRPRRPLPTIGHADKAITIAEETIAAARAHANPVWVALALAGYGRAHTHADPTRALTALRDGLNYTRKHRIPFLEAVIARDLAELEAVHGDLGQAFTLFDATIDAFHRAGAVHGVTATLANLVTCLDRLDRPEIAATIYGTTTNSGPDASVSVNFAGAVDHLRTVLGQATFDRSVATGAAMNLADAVAFAREQIRLAHNDLETASPT